MKRAKYLCRALSAVQAVASGLICLSLAVPSGTQANESEMASRLEQESTFNIAAQPLDAALLEFSKQSNVQVMLVGEEEISSTNAPAVKGKITAREALVSLLENTGFRYTTIQNGTVTIKRIRTSMEAGERLAVAQAEGTTEQGAALEEKGEQEEALQLDEIVVTGTHIRGAKPVGSPLQTYDRAAIDRTGAATVSQFLRTLPMNFGSVDGVSSVGNVNTEESSNNLSRGTSINLRGVGAGGTLTLLNGHRLAPTGLDGSLIDVSTIPLAAVERIEVMPDGASAIYGADAVAGVVNFVLRRQFSGAETTLNYGSSTRGGGQQRGASQLFGTSWAGGNVVFTYEHFDQEPIRASQRDFVPDFHLGTSITGPQDRDSLFASARQAISTRASVFSDFLYSRRSSSGRSDQFFGAPVFTTFASDQDALSAVIGLDRELGGGWQAQLVGHFSTVDVDLKNAISISPVISHFGTRSRVTSGELRSDGPLFKMPGGQARASLGAQWRNEKFDDRTVAIASFGTGLERDVKSAFAEIMLPVVGPDNARSGIRSLSVSLAGRYDSYGDIGSATDPKLGIAWSPVGGFDLRASYGESFRAAPLAQLSDNAPFALASNFADQGASGGISSAIFIGDAGNPDLKPETSRSWTAGMDWHPGSLPGTELSVTYFDIRYRDRIAPPRPTTPFLSDPALEPFNDRAPTAERIHELFTRPGFLVFGGLTEADIDLISDRRRHNVAATRTSGVDLQGNLLFEKPLGQIGITLSGTYLLENEFQAVSTVPAISQLDIVFWPVALRLRGGVNWSRGPLGAVLAVNYTGDSRDTFSTPVRPIASWTTTDFQLSYRDADDNDPALLQGWGIALSIQNVLDIDPPKIVASNLVAPTLGYDPSNASPVGRFISLQASKRW